MTARREAEERLRGSEARLRFLDRLAEATQPLTDPTRIMAATARLLGEHMGASLCAYADMDADQDGFTIRGDWAAPGSRSIVGRYHLADFGRLAVTKLSAGLPLVVNDNGRELAPEEAATFQSIGIAATICVPLVKEGRLTALMAVHSASPRDWSPAELALVADTTQRSWAHVERVAAVAELRASEARLEAIANSIDQMVWSTRPDGFHDYYNQRWYDYTGMPEGSTDGDAWNGVFHAHDQERAWAVWRHSLETGEPYHIEYRLRHRSGQYRWVLGRAQAVRDEAGRIARWYGTCTDIQDIVEAREVLARSREELEAAVTARTAERNRVWAMSRDLLAIMGFDGFLKAVNPAWETTLGLDEAALLACPLGGQVHPDDLVAAGESIERLRRGEVVERFEDRLRHADGSWRWISWGLVPEGDVFYAVGRDVTEEKERAAALRLYENIVQSDNSPVCAFDTDFRLIAFNKAHSDEFFRIFGHRVQVGEVFPDLFPPDQAPVIRGFMARALAGEVFTVTEEFGDPDLSKPYWDVAYTPLRDDAGRIIGAFHHAQDITARLRAQAELAAAQEQLRQAQKMEAMGQLTGGVAHDFNNLLTPIMGVLDRLLNRGAGDERERRLMAGALEAAERAKVLVQRLLAFARRQPLQPVAVDVRGLVEGMAELIGSTLGPKISVRVELASSLPPAQADANQLEMALLNLAVNARDAMPEGGRLTIAASREGVRGKHSAGLKVGHYVRLSVADTGVGMDAATRERAVEPFFSTKGIGKGTGLGLSMVHGLAAQLGGGLVIESEPGQGTNVELWLPISADAIDEAGSARSVPRPVASRGRALLVDDEELVRMSTADMLADLGFDVLEAGSAEDALQIVHKGAQVDLLVTDHLMPGMSGADLARKLKVLRPDLPILIVSGYADVDGLAPDLPRLTKPFRAAELAQRVVALVPGASPAE